MQMVLAFTLTSLWIQGGEYGKRNEHSDVRESGKFYQLLSEKEKTQVEFISDLRWDFNFNSKMKVVKVVTNNIWKKSLIFHLQIEGNFITNMNVLVTIPKKLVTFATVSVVITSPDR